MPNPSCHPLIDHVQLAIDRLTPKPAGIVVAVSGGPDSVALLLALHEIGVRPLFIGHINHRLRAGDSDMDEQFVRQLSQQLAVPIDVHRIDTAAQAVGQNLEATARRLRYSALRQIATNTGVTVVATGHTADDQAETVLFRLLRGSGLTGLAAIRASRRWQGLTIVRPMLAVRRDVVLDYLQARGQSYRHDSTNFEARFTRNRIRHELLPLAEETINARVVEHLARLAERAAEAAALIKGLIRRRLKRVELARSAQLVILDAEAMAKMSDSLIREMGRYIWLRERWPTADMNVAHWDRFVATCRGNTTAVDFPGGISSRRLPRVVRIGPGA